MTNMDYHKTLEETFYDSIGCKERTLEHLGEHITQASQMLAEALLAERKIFLCGEGLAALDAQRFASQLVHGFTMERSAFPALVLGAGLSSLADLPKAANPLEDTFIQQVETLAASDDVLIVISSSGTPLKLGGLIKFALNKGLAVLVIDSKKINTSPQKGEEELEGTTENNQCLHLTVLGNKVARIQETHVLIINILCHLVEKEIFSL